MDTLFTAIRMLSQTSESLSRSVRALSSADCCAANLTSAIAYCQKWGDDALYHGAIRRMDAQGTMVYNEPAAVNAVCNIINQVPMHTRLVALMPSKELLNAHGFESVSDLYLNQDSNDEACTQLFQALDAATHSSLLLVSSTSHACGGHK